MKKKYETDIQDHMSELPPVKTTTEQQAVEHIEWILGLDDIEVKLDAWESAYKIIVDNEIQLSTSVWLSFLNDDDIGPTFPDHENMIKRFESTIPRPLELTAEEQIEMDNVEKAIEEGNKLVDEIYGMVIVGEDEQAASKKFMDIVFEDKTQSEIMLELKELLISMAKSDNPHYDKSLIKDTLNSIEQYIDEDSYDAAMSVIEEKSI